MVYEVGIYDMPKGWINNSKLNKRIYKCWSRMIERCYCKNRKSYEYYGKVGCYVCDRWLMLSNFVNDISKIDGYELWLNNPNQRVALDKDIKSNGKNKCYCLEQCMFVNGSENSKQTHKTRNYDKITGNNHYNYGKHRDDDTKQKISNTRKEKELAKGENNPNYGNRYEKNKNSIKVVQLDYDGNIIKIWLCIKKAEEELGITKGGISKCLKNKQKSTNDKYGNKTYWKYYNKGE